jgi:hypothetical protein
VKADPTDRTARLDCQIGAWLSMAGANNDGTGLSRPIGLRLADRGGIAGNGRRRIASE